MPPPEPAVAGGSLAATQRAFAAAVRGGPAAAEALLAELKGRRETNLRRLAAYHRNIVGNWIAALRSSYPQLAVALGPTTFDALAGAFTVDHDSSSGDLNEYGEAFGDWLATRPIAASRPWLPDLARLEWDVQAAWYAADAEPFDFALLAGVAAEQHGTLRFRLAPAFRSRRSAWPLAELWRTPEATPTAPGDYHVWIVRPFDRVGVEAASAGEFAFLAALAAGRPLLDAIANALVAAGDFDVGTSIARAAGLGLFAGFTSGESA